MLALCIISFSLLSTVLAAPLSCQDLLKPLNSTDYILGKWTLIAQANDLPGAREVVAQKMINSWTHFTPGTQNNTIDGLEVANIDGQCFSVNATLVIENNKFTKPLSVPMTETLLHTCSDCLLLHTEISLVDNYSQLNLYSKRKELSPVELDVFKKQVDCLNMPPAVFTKPERDPCPDPRDDNRNVLDMKKILGDNFDYKKFLERIINEKILEGNKAN
ncbi:hypothetical protein UPYG_G00276700 [Umbra pygmaea]|uniref:Uncharacterized protein n=1 Tax=Umbra pygmaea TaxID=75934 RepID=A0ABD0W6S0_UMBPY